MHKCELFTIYLWCVCVYIWKLCVYLCLYHHVKFAASYKCEPRETHMPIIRIVYAFCAFCAFCAFYAFCVCVCIQLFVPLLLHLFGKQRQNGRSSKARNCMNCQTKLLSIAIGPGSSAKTLKA